MILNLAGLKLALSTSWRPRPFEKRKRMAHLPLLVEPVALLGFLGCHSVNVLACDWFKLRFQGTELGSLRTYASNFAKLQNSSFMNYGKHSPLFLSFVQLQDLYSKPFSRLYLCDLFNVKWSLTGMLRDR